MLRRGALGALLSMLLTYVGEAQAQRRHHHTPPPPPPPPPSPALTVTFTPQMPSIPDSTPLGAFVATVTAAWSDGAPFTGTLMFGPPAGDDGGTFALSCMSCASANIVINPAGMGVSGDGGTTQQITVAATQ